MTPFANTLSRPIRRTPLAASILFATFAASILAAPIPPGTAISTDFKCNEKNPASSLIDGDPATTMGGTQGSARNPAHVFLSFPQPLPLVAGVVTGKSDPFGNYYAKRIEFWADTDGDAKFETFAGTVIGLGPGAKGEGRHVFQKPVKNVHHLLMRVVEQNMTALNRSFSMSELELITDAAGAAPNSGAEPLLEVAPPPLKRKPQPVVVASMGKPEALVPAGGPWSLINAQRNKQAGNPVDGRAAYQIKWSSGATTLAEINAPSRPIIHAFKVGVRIELTVDKTEAPQLTSWGLRTVDANGEIWQFGGAEIPAGKGPVSSALVLDPNAANTTNWGGAEAGRGEIDPPLRLGSLVFNLPASPTKECSIRLGPLLRNEVDPLQIDPEILLLAVESKVVTDGPMNLITVGNEAKAAVRLELGANAKPLSFGIEILCTGFDGSTRSFRKDGLKLAPGASLDVPFGKVLDRLGWWEIKPVLLTTDGKGRVARPATMVGRIDPVGSRPKPTADDFWFGIDARLNEKNHELLADTCAMIGADIIRGGVTWPGVEKTQGQFDWVQHDKLIKSINQRGMHVQYGFTFTPPWAAYPEQIERLKKDGQPEWRVTMTPPRIDAWRSYINRAMAHIREQDLKVGFFEIWNEPDLYGFWRGTTEQYLETLRVASEEIRKADPAAKVMTGGFAVVGGHGGQTNNPDLIERTVVGTQKHYDVLNIHEHGPFGIFQPRLDGGWGSLRRQLDPPKPLYLNETGAAFNDPSGRLKQAHELIKKFALARQRGAVGFNWFCLNFFGHEHGYSMITSDNQPYPVLPAYNAMVRLMRGKQAAGEIEVGPGNWLFRLEGGGDTLLIAWDESAPSPGTRVPIIVPSGASVFKVDVMGNESPITVEQGVFLWELTKEVAYLHVRGGSPRVAPPLVVPGTEPYGEPGKEVTVTATLHNPMPAPAEVTVTWTGHDSTRHTEQVTVPASGKATAALRQVMPTVTDRQQPEVKFAYEFHAAGWTGGFTLPMFAARLIPSGAIDSREPDFVADTEANVFNTNQADPNRAQWTWQGPADISTKVWVGLDGGDLLLRADVRDEKHIQPNPAEAAWKADCVQFGLFIPDLGGHWELGLSRNDAGKNQVSCWRMPVGCSKKITEKIKLEVTDIEGGLRYRARIPVEQLGTNVAMLRHRAIGFNLIVNDEDGGGREGWAFIADGFGIDTKPRLWPLISFGAEKTQAATASPTVDGVKKNPSN